MHSFALVCLYLFKTSFGPAFAPKIANGGYATTGQLISRPTDQFITGKVFL